MRMKRIAPILASASFLLGVSLSAAAADSSIAQSWVSNPVKGDFWGYKRCDIDGDGRLDDLLLKRDKVIIGHFIDKDFKAEGSCGWGDGTQAARFDPADIDGDGRQEIIITGLDAGRPSSHILRWSGGECAPIADGSPWFARAVEIPDGEGKQKIHLLGQLRDGGAVHELNLAARKIIAGKRIELPKGVGIFEFAFINSANASKSIVLQRERSALSIMELIGNRYKKVWSGGPKFAGSSNSIEISDMRALDGSDGNLFQFNPPPLYSFNLPQGLLFVVDNRLVAGGVFGRRPTVNSSQVRAFRSDPVFGEIELFATKLLPGEIVDLSLERTADGKVARLIILLRQYRGFLKGSEGGIIVSYDLKGVEDDLKIEKK